MRAKGVMRVVTAAYSRVLLAWPVRRIMRGVVGERGGPEMVAWREWVPIDIRPDFVPVDQSILGGSWVIVEEVVKI